MTLQTKIHLLFTSCYHASNNLNYPFIDDLPPVRSAQQNLHEIRNNVVVLLTALLPQLDLAGISIETADIDNILQQIIEVNSLKL